MIDGDDTMTTKQYVHTRMSVNIKYKTIVKVEISTYLLHFQPLHIGFYPFNKSLLFSQCENSKSVIFTD